MELTEQQTPVVAEAAELMAVQQVEPAAPALSLFVMPMSPPSQHSLQQSQSLQGNRTLSA
jgi:hypothetical protein